MIMIIIEIQGKGTALLWLVNSRMPHQNNGTVLPSYINYHLKSEQKNESTTVWKATTKITDNFHCKWKPSQAYLNSLGEDKWETKEDTGKSIKNTLYIQWCGNRHLSGWSDVEQWKNQVHILSSCWVMLVWRISYLVSQSVNQSVSKWVSQSVHHSVDNNCLKNSVATFWKWIWKLVLCNQ